MIVKYTDVIKELNKLADKEKAKILARFFKTGKGQYGFGDAFIGITVPKQREVAKRFSALPLLEIQKLLKSKIHEHRLTALLILTKQFEKGDEKFKNKAKNFYLKNTRHVNNWDLVDLSAPNILGSYLQKRPKNILYKLARSKNLWERRMSIVSTAFFIKEGSFKDTLKISKILLSDKHDLIHKAVGWMLREVGKKDKKVLVQFLNKHIEKMPRTSLRYSIERFPERERQKFLSAH